MTYSCLLKDLLIASVIFSLGCGGGASGTGGVVGDLNPSQKVQALDEVQVGELCRGIVSVATDALRDDHLYPSNHAFSELYAKYVDYSDHSGNGTEGATSNSLRPIFFETSPAAFKSECESFFNEGLSLVAQAGECFDISQLPPELQSSPGAYVPAGACDLRSPALEAFDVTVGQYSECVSDFISQIAFSPKATIRCEDAYEIFRLHDWNEPFDLGDLIPIPLQGSRDLPPSCRDIQKPIGRSNLTLAPVACTTGLPGEYESKAFPTLFLTDD